MTREEANQVASGDLMAKESENQALRSQVEILTQRLAATEEKLKSEKSKVKEVIQA